MNNLIKEYKDEVESLINEGDKLLKVLTGDNKNLLKFREEYEIWYSKSLLTIKFLIPDRLEDFKDYYQSKKKKDDLKTAINYTPPRREGMKISFDEEPPEQIDYARSLFTNQLGILKTLKSRFESKIFDIYTLIQSELFDRDLDASRDLLRHKYFRASGVIAGVVLEKHLKSVLELHYIKISKKDPGISDLNDLLKNNSVIEVVNWRYIQRLSDIRNLCGHNKSREPMKDEVEELITGVEKVIKTIM